MSNEKIGILFRLLNNLSLSVFADRLGVTKAMICNFEVGRSKSKKLEDCYSSMRLDVLSKMKDIVEEHTDEWGQII